MSAVPGAVLPAAVEHDGSGSALFGSWQDGG